MTKKKIIPFPKGHLEITCGLVVQEETRGSDGVRRTINRTSRFAVFVEGVGADGSRVCLWEGDSVDAAIQEARELVAEGWGREFGPRGWS
ncbi:hypothetical protein D2T31_10840 [Sinirhodobacter populi]|uniref:Uncharacterized protein n=1 Tax=Paenirhodobacter populi TaxID=2306993 RepID=A0A443K9J7_9RHOB|nr:hypothetical protein [Sinirhodobacter populi]RWR29469.1 hypothetical protein D2T31_10840 [Sinirhodobacter populi]